MLPCDDNVTVLAEIGILYSSSTSRDEDQRPYFIKQVGDDWVTLLISPHLTSINWISPSHGHIKRITDLECKLLKSATWIDCDNTGKIYVLSEHEKRISVIDHRGKLLKEHVLDIEGRPIYIRLVRDGLLLVCSWKPGGVFLIDKGGRVRWNFSPGDSVLKEASSAFWSPSNCFYIADAGLHRIIVVSMEKKIIKEYGTSGSPGYGPKNFSHPYMIEPGRASTMLVCDTRNHRVIKMDDAGRIIWEWPHRRGFSSFPTQLFMPQCVRELENGDLIISDTHNSRILYLNKSLELVNSFGSTSIKSRLISFPRSVQYLDNGNYLIADTYNNRIVELNKNSEVCWQFTHRRKGSREYKLFWPRRALRLRDGTTVIVDSRNNRIIFIDPWGNILRVITHVSSRYGISALSDPHDITQCPDGSYLLADTGNNRILKIDNDGHCWGSYPENGDNSNLVKLSDPHQVSHSHHNGLIVSDTGNNRVLVFDSELRCIKEIKDLTFCSGEDNYSLNEPRCCYFRYGHYWILDSGNSRLIIANKEHQVIWSWTGDLGSSPIPRVYLPRWFTVLSSSKILISDYFNGRILLMKLPKLTIGVLSPRYLNSSSALSH